MSAPETREQRWARMKAAEQAARELRATLPPINPDTLQIAMGGASTFDEHGDPVCGRCRYDEPVGLVFGIVVNGIGKLCKECVESTGRRGKALVELVNAVESIDSAIALAPLTDRRDLVHAARVMVSQWLPERFGLLGPVSAQ